MRIAAFDFVILLNLILAVVLDFLNILNPVGCAVYALITSALIIWNAIKTDNKRITYTTALLLYTIATQFGLVIPYLLVGRDSFHSYSDYTLRFMQSVYLPHAIMIGIIGVTSMRIGTLIARRKISIDKVVLTEYDDGDKSANRMYIAGIVLLAIVIMFFAYNALTGGMRLISTYEVFRQSSAYNSNIYSYILILFYVGTIYLASAGKVMKHKAGWGIWTIIVLIFALNGNKGEFMYAMLAVVGMKGVEGKRINWKMLLVFGLTLFIVIPGITSLRNIGIIGNFRNAQIDIFDAFGEMGMQVRMSVYTLQDLADGKYGYLYGKSYVQPIINIVTPFLSHSQATSAVRVLYPGHGYSQIIESYLNFKIFGTIGFFIVLGWFIGKREVLVADRSKLAYLGTIVCIFINATRNYFAFVPGHIILITIIYLFVRGIKIAKH